MTLRIAHAALGAVIITAATLAPLHAQEGEGQVGPAIGSAAAAATVEDLDGNEVELLDYIDGKPALIEFWASWCENCEALQPQLDEIQAAHGDQIQVVAVAVAVAQSIRRVKRHVDQHGAGYPYLWDAKGNAVRAYNALTTSVVVLLDEDGTVVYTGVGAGQDLRGAVAQVLTGS